MATSNLDMLTLLTREAAEGLAPQVLADVTDSARTDLFAAMLFSYAANLPPATSELLGMAWMERVALTKALHKAGLLPRHLPLSGPEPVADTWLVKNIEQLRGTHPLFEEWAALNDERLLVSDHLPAPPAIH